MKNIRQLNKISVLPRSAKTIENYSPQFSSAVVHDVRNPLTNIVLSATQLLPLVETNDEAKMYLDIIIRSAERINKIVSTLLQVNASETMKREEYSVHQLLKEVLEIVADRIRLKHIAVNRNYETQDCKALINVREMRLALTNIIINALDAMTIDIGQLNIITRSVADKFIIQIKDNGCGISEENLKNIFKLHFTNKPGGLGVGLASTWDILKSNHVGVNVNSAEGMGTCFDLLFDKGYHQDA